MPREVKVTLVDINGRPLGERRDVVLVDVNGRRLDGRPQADERGADAERIQDERARRSSLMQWLAAIFGPTSG